MTKKVKKQLKSTPKRQGKRLSTLRSLEERVKALEQLNNTIQINVRKETINEI